MELIPYFFLSSGPSKGAALLENPAASKQLSNFRSYQTYVIKERPSAGQYFRQPIADTCRKIESIDDLAALFTSLRRALSSANTVIVIDDVRRLFANCADGYGNTLFKELKRYGSRLYILKTQCFFSEIGPRQGTNILLAKSPVQYTYRAK